jgi:ERCC4-type nuclease
MDAARYNDAAMKKSKPDPPVVLIDDREKRPLPLPNSRVQRLEGCGDYSLEGFEDVVRVERKSLGDLYMCVGSERERFKRSLAKLAKLPYRAIVIEASFADILAGFQYSDVHPHQAVGSIIAWSTRHGLPIWLAGDRRAAAGIVLKILCKAAEYHLDSASNAE